tara:strand:- start:650 stop:868 length:219 start_codon:yes stop_codon:yes gene_type:complete
MSVPNKLEQDMISLSRELGSNWNKANSKRYKDLAKHAGIPHDEEYVEELDTMDDYNISGWVRGDTPIKDEAE